MSAALGTPISRSAPVRLQIDLQPLSVVFGKANVDEDLHVHLDGTADADFPAWKQVPRRANPLSSGIRLPLARVFVAIWRSAFPGGTTVRCLAKEPDHTVKTAAAMK